MPGKTALIIDDEGDVRTVVAGILEQEGWQTLEAANGLEGVHMAVQTIPDLIVLDIIMPVKDGFETFFEVRSEPKTAFIPIIILTGVNEFELGAAHTAESIGAQFNVPPPEAFIEKPINPALLQAAVRHITA